MIVNVAKTAGFCFGVNRAIGMVNKEIVKGGKVYTFGPIIHNEDVVMELCNLGVGVINDVDELEGIYDASLIIRAHGITKDIYDKIHSLQNEGKAKLNIVDATCPFVRKIYEIIHGCFERNEHPVVAGDKKHPEVQGIIGWSENKAYVIEDISDIDNLPFPKSEKICLIAQTTYNYTKFQELVEILNEKGYDVNVVNTICNATEERQKEALTLAKASEAMIVIGGEHSSNTRKLFDISKSECKNTYYIQKLGDLDLKQFKSLRSVGITAGASTPNKIIKEVQEVMSETSFEQMLEESLKTIHNGEVVEGTVIRVKEDEIALNIGYKADGIITRSEYTNIPGLDLTTVVKEGDVMQAKVLKVNDGEGQVVLTYRRLAAERGSKRLEEAFNNNEVLKARVVAALEGGLNVVVDETRVFIPASLVSDSYEKNLDKYKDQEIEFVITEFNPKRRRIIGDRKRLLVAQKQESMKALFEKIKVGDKVTGKVKNITDFGAFIDLGGADGLLHISEMSWGRIENPKKVFKVDDEVTAFIKDIAGEKIALSLKFPEANPWADANEKFAIGNVVTGRVARMTDFGAFVELVPGVDALLHVSQISREHVEKPSDVLKINQEVTAKIVDFNIDDHKISLSIKALEMPANEAEDEAKEETAE